MILTLHDLVLFDSSLYAERKYSLLWGTYELFKNCAGAQLSTQANRYRKTYVEIRRRPEFSACSKIFYITKFLGLHHTKIYFIVIKSNPQHMFFSSK